MDLEFALNKQNLTDADKRRAFENAAREQEMKHRFDLVWASDTCDIISERLKNEEKKSKVILDKKIDAKHTMDDTKDDYTLMFTRKVDNR